MERMLRKKKKNNKLDTNKIGDELLITNCLFLVGHPTELQHITLHRERSADNRVLMVKQAQPLSSP